jgi:ribosomal protein S9
MENLHRNIMVKTRGGGRTAIVTAIQKSIVKSIVNTRRVRISQDQEYYTHQREDAVSI